MYSKSFNNIWLGVPQLNLKWRLGDLNFRTKNGRISFGRLTVAFEVTALAFEVPSVAFEVKAVAFEFWRPDRISSGNPLEM